MPDHPSFAGCAFLGLGLLLLMSLLVRGTTFMADPAGISARGNRWWLVLSVLFTVCGLFNLSHLF